MAGIARGTAAPEAARGERGVALILALLALVVLTLLGLTLATTTTSELTIASNYRWSRQAQYNAEAGMEIAMALLTEPTPGIPGDPDFPLYAARTTAWAENTPPPLPAGSGLDYYPNSIDPGCDRRGGVGYGIVLLAGGTRLEDVSGYAGQEIPGTFTAWIRRELVPQADGTFKDNDANDVAVLTVMGTAPSLGPLTAEKRARQAVRVLEVTLAKVPSKIPCADPHRGQAGLGPLNDGFDPCNTNPKVEP